MMFCFCIGMIFMKLSLLLLDYIGNFYRHVLGPRVVGDQQQLNLRFMGGGNHGLTERSTNLGYYEMYGSYYKGKTVDARLSEDTTMAWYTPQIQKDDFDHSFIVCNISSIDTMHTSEIFGWSSRSSFESSNMYYDFPSPSHCSSVV